MHDIMEKNKCRYEPTIHEDGWKGVKDNETGATYSYNGTIDLMNELQHQNNTLNDYIDTLFEGNTHICKELDIESAKFHCPYFKGYKEPTCTYMECFDCDELIPLNQRIDEVINGEKLRYGMDKNVYEVYDYDKRMSLKDIVERLNSQDKTIRHLKEQNSMRMLSEMKPFYCKGTYIYVDKDGNITSEARKL